MGITVTIEAISADEARSEMQRLLGGTSTGLASATDRFDVSGNEVVAPAVVVTAPAVEAPKRGRGRPAAATKAPEPEKTPEPAAAPAGNLFDEDEDKDKDETAEPDDLIGGFVITPEGVKAAMTRYSEVFGIEKSRENLPGMLGFPKWSSLRDEATPEQVAEALKAITTALAAA
jgi:hypothetical protein